MDTSRQIFAEFVQDVVDTIFRHHDSTYAESIAILRFDSYECEGTDAT